MNKLFFIRIGLIVGYVFFLTSKAAAQGLEYKYECEYTTYITNEGQEDPDIHLIKTTLPQYKCATARGGESDVVTCFGRVECFNKQTRRSVYTNVACNANYGGRSCPTATECAAEDEVTINRTVNVISREIGRVRPLSRGGQGIE